MKIESNYSNAVYVRLYRKLVVVAARACVPSYAVDIQLHCSRVYMISRLFRTRLEWLIKNSLA